MHGDNILNFSDVPEFMAGSIRSISASHNDVACGGGETGVCSAHFNTILHDFYTELVP